MLYDDSFLELYQEGVTDIKRASHIEPEGLLWKVDIVNGPSALCKTKQEALQFEIDWINKHL